MSYCRWSIDKSDVYVYKSDDGFHVHVGSRRLVNEAPEVPWVLDYLTEESRKEWARLVKKQMDLLETAEYSPITLPYAGESFIFDSSTETADFLEKLQKLRYDVPQYAIERLRAEG